MPRGCRWHSHCFRMSGHAVPGQAINAAPGRAIDGVIEGADGVIA